MTPLYAKAESINSYSPRFAYVYLFGFFCLFVCLKTTLKQLQLFLLLWRASRMKQKGEHRPQEKEEERRKNDESSESQSLDLWLRRSYTSTEQHVPAPGSWYKSLFPNAPLSLHISSPFGIDRKKHTIQARRGKTWYIAQSCSLFCLPKKIHINVKSRSHALIGLGKD